MQKHGQTVFLIEELQDSWLRSEAEKKISWTLYNGIGGFLLILCCIPLMIDFYGPVSGAKRTVLFLLAGVLIFVLILLLSARNSKIIGRHINFEQRLQKKQGNKISGVGKIQVIAWSWDNMKNNYRAALRDFAIVVLIFFIISIFAMILGIKAEKGWLVPLAGLIGGIIFGTIAGLIKLIFAGLESQVSEATNKPNEGIKTTFRIAITGGLFIGATIGLIMGLAYGLLLTFLFSLFFGGILVLRHYALRFLIYNRGYGPWNYAKFLDYCAEELQFLQKVGGGYMFIHRYLLEYFAEQRPEQDLN